MTSSMEERLKLVKNSMSKEIALEEVQKCESLEEFYHCAKKIQNGVFAQMEVYILENYKSVPLKTWNEGSFELIPHMTKEHLRFGKEDEFVSRWKNSKVLKDMEKRRWDKSIKITSISFTLDEHDGDFSVKFNNDPWGFIWESEILTYYYTIKNYLTDGI